MALELIVLLSLPLILGSWLDHGFAPATLITHTQLNFIIKHLIHGNILPLGGGKDDFDLVAPEQSGWVDVDFVSRIGARLSGSVTS